MPQFTVTMELKGAGERTFTMYGNDRNDVIAFAKKSYRRIFKRVKSCKKLKPARCAARAESDQMRCSTCDRVWDFNDDSPCNLPG